MVDSNKATKSGANLGRVLIQLSGVGVFLAIKRRWIILSFFLLSAVGSVILVIDMATGTVQNAAGAAAFALIGVLASVLGLTPLLSRRWRDRVCRENADFDHAVLSLIVVASTGLVFVVYGICSTICRVTGLSIPQYTLDWFFEAIFPYAILVLLVSVFGVLIVRRRAKATD